MNFDGTCQAVCQLPAGPLKRFAEAVKDLDLTKIANYRDYYGGSDVEGWVRAERGVSEHNLVLKLPGARELLQTIIDRFPMHRVLIFGLSRLNPKQKVFAHSDHLLMHRLQDRILSPITYNEGCVNRWLVNGRWVETRMVPGTVYRFNDAIVHEAWNDGDAVRDVLKLHIIDRRLEDKFAGFSDLAAPVGKSKNDEHVNAIKGLTRYSEGRKL